MPDARRQLGQYKRMIREEQQNLRWVWVFWAVPAVFVVLAFYLDWHWAAKVLTVWGVVAGVMQQSDVKAKIWLYEKKVAELEETARL